jgi:hypothetical protein
LQAAAQPDFIMSGSTHETDNKGMAEHHNNLDLEQTHTANGTKVVKTVHADGVVDLLDAKAVGGEMSDMPKGYYTSYQFVLTFVAICFASICAYLGWVLPANTL